jgi:DNA primase
MSQIEEVKSHLDIVDVIGQYVPLKKVGRTHKGLCPFHSEKTPSFVVSPDRQSWHCFGACGTGGDVFSFVMRREGIDFAEALRTLAPRAGVTLQERPRDPEQDRARERLYAANETAARFYHDLLLNDPTAKPALQYVRGRGIDEATADSFLLGYSPDSWDATRNHLKERGFSDAELLSAGLLVQGEREPYDRFRNRLTFPIRDAKGRFVGIGARALDDSTPKYLNTAQTAAFDKGALLYALDRAQEAIRDQGAAVLVEGYMDVIAAHQSGFTNVVATMGTSLTERQVRLLKRHTRSVILALDADAAGSEAALRGHEVVTEALHKDGEREAVPVVNWRGLIRYQDATAVDLKVAVLPEGRDPDEVIRSDPDLWRELIASARPVLDYRFEAATARHELAEPRGRSEAVQELLPLLEPLADPVVRAHYLQRLSRMSLLKEEELSRMLRRRNTRQAPESAGGAHALTDTRGDARPEEFLLALLIQFPNLREAGLEVPETLFWEAPSREVLSAWRQSPEIDTVKASLGAELNGHFERLLNWRLPEYGEGEAKAALADCVARLERRQTQAERQATAAMLAELEEELGASSLVEAVASGAEPDSETVKVAVNLHRKDMESGLKLHEREREEPGGSPA